ncbi:MAG: hypothetical protein ACKVH8_11745, partial [Pirellulales bacterium]
MNTQQKSNGLKYVLFGCLGTILLVMVAFCGGAIYIYSISDQLIEQGAQKLREVGSDLAQETFGQLIDESLLPEDQKVGMKAEIQRVTDGVKSGEIVVPEKLLRLFKYRVGTM